jgi:hypothetical protein
MTWSEIVKENINLVNERNFKALYKKVSIEDRKQLYDLFKSIGVNPYEDIKQIKDIGDWLSGSEVFYIDEAASVVSDGENTPEIDDFFSEVLGNISVGVEDFKRLDRIKRTPAGIRELNAKFASFGLKIRFSLNADKSVVIFLDGVDVTMDPRTGGDPYICGTLMQWPPLYIDNLKIRFRWEEQ